MEPGSHVRTSELTSIDEQTRSTQRVVEFLAALGLSAEDRCLSVAEEIVATVLANTGAITAADAVAEAQARVSAFEDALFGARAAELQPLWWRSFIEAHPRAFLGDIAEARRAVARFGDPFEGTAPRAVRFGEPMHVDAIVPRWFLFLAFPTLLSAVATYMLRKGLGEFRSDPVGIAFIACFALLFSLSAIGFSTALIGFAAGFVRPRPRRSVTPLPRTAVLVPVYNESAEDVFAGILAMRESLARTGEGDHFEFVVLSDTRDVLCAADEERAYRRAVASSPAGSAIFYRRRVQNLRQKSGNLAEFFERYGDRYRYAVVLDADSLMRGDTIVDMVRRMDANPNLALLQAPLALHRGVSLFARAQQLVASVCGPLFMRGLAVWSGPQGNYYGHNAVVRVRAFLDCCALPELRGEPPFGGHILSHDFVEAALLCRAGYDVRIAWDLAGSWEELPQSLPDYVARDRRWCQGNLQHLRIAFSAGFRPMSRMHMLVGALAYMASPLWLLFVVLSAALSLRAPGGFLAREYAVPLLAVTCVMLFSPRVFGLVETLKTSAGRRAHGGALRLSASVGFEALLSVVLSPLMMLHHSRIVFSIVAGRSVRWAAQQRRARSALQRVMRPEVPATIAGVSLAACALVLPPKLALWLLPLWGPWCFAVPIALLVSSARVGSLTRSLGLLLVPSEVAPDEITFRVDDFRSVTAADGSARFRDIVLDPVLNRAHLTTLEHAQRGLERAAPSVLNAQAATLSVLCERAARGGPTALDAREQMAVLRDVASVRALHREAWRHWPVESWGLSRLGPQLPPLHDEPSSL